MYFQVKHTLFLTLSATSSLFFNSSNFYSTCFENNTDNKMYDSFDINKINRSNLYFDPNNLNFQISQMILNLINCVNLEPALLGEEISYFDYFKWIRSNEQYSLIFKELSTLPAKYTNSILIMLSLIPFENVTKFEKEFVLKQLDSKNVISQEYSLNAISIWNNDELISQISNKKLSNYLLQESLLEIVKK